MIKKSEALAHVVFDNDGTMVNSEGNFFEVLLEVLPKHLGREMSVVEIEDAYIPDWYQMLKNFGVMDPSPEFAQKIINDVNEINKDFTPKLYPGIIELIKELHSINVATYVWTGRDTYSGRKIFKDHKMIDLFTDMHFMDTSVSKPHPDGLEMMLSGVDKSKIVLLGDSTVDLTGAANFGIECLIVDWNQDIDREHFLRFGANDFVEKPSDLVKWVKSHLI